MLQHCREEEAPALPVYATHGVFAQSSWLTVGHSSCVALSGAARTTEGGGGHWLRLTMSRLLSPPLVACWQKSGSKD